MSDKSPRSAASYMIIVSVEGVVSRAEVISAICHGEPYIREQAVILAFTLAAVGAFIRETISFHEILLEASIALSVELDVAEA